MDMRIPPLNRKVLLESNPEVWNLSSEIGRAAKPRGSQTYREVPECLEEGMLVAYCAD